MMEALVESFGQPPVGQPAPSQVSLTLSPHPPTPLSSRPPHRLTSLPPPSPPFFVRRESLPNLIVTTGDC